MSDIRVRARLLWRSVIEPPWRDPLIACTMFGFGVAYFVGGLHEAIWRDPRDRPLWVDLAVVAAFSVTELFRARAPRAALRTGLALTAACVLWAGTSLVVVLVMIDLLYASVLHGPRRRSRLIVAVVLALVPIATVARYLDTGGDWRAAVIAMLTVVAVPVTAVWWAMQVRLHRDVAESARARAEQVARIAEMDRRAAVHAERVRMARDLHDVVAGHLSAIAIQAEALRGMLDEPGGGATSVPSGANGSAPDRSGSPAQELVSSVRENSVRALAEMRTMIGLLRRDDETGAESPGLRDLDALVESAQAAGVRLDTAIGAMPDLPTAVDLAGYRIIQEALTNVVRHAPDGPATLSVRCDDGRVMLDLRNAVSGSTRPRRELGPDSTPPQPDPSSAGGGLENMRERAASVGGSVTFSPGPREWRVSAVLPVEEPA